MEKSKTFRNLFAIIKWECYNKQTCRVEIDSAVILVLSIEQSYFTDVLQCLIFTYFSINNKLLRPYRNKKLQTQHLKFF